MYGNKKKSHIMFFDFALWDIVCIQASLVLSYAIRHSGDFVYNNPDYLIIAGIAGIMSLILFCSDSKVVWICERKTGIEILDSVKHTLLVIVCILFYMFATQKTVLFSRIAISLWGITNVFLTSFVRCAWKQVHIKIFLQGEYPKSIVVITENSEIEKILSEFQKNENKRFRISLIGAFDFDKNQNETTIPIVNAKEIVERIRSNWVDEVFFSENVIDRKHVEVEKISSACLEMGITVHAVISSADFSARNIMIEDIAGYKVLSQNCLIVDEWKLVLKRLIDIIGSCVGCVITLALSIFIGPIIKKSSPGPIFFAQDRIGRNGRRFRIYKFRSMHVGAEEQKEKLLSKNQISGQAFKVENDPRIIQGIGTFIRKTSIDEFPQFFNVLRGEMSLVGTRPPTVDEWETYELHHRKRLAVKPGITGLWQVSGRNKIKDFEEIVRLDTKYIAEWSIWLDLSIIIKTIGVVIKGDGAM